MKTKPLVAATVAILVMLTGAWAFGWFGGDYSDDPEVARIEKLRDETFDDQTEMSDQQMREAGEQLKKQAANLSDDQRKELWKRSMPIFMPMMMKRAERDMDRFLALSPEEQRAEMDEKLRSGQGRWGGGPGGNRGGNRPKPSAEQVGEFMKKLNDWTTPEQRAKFEIVKGMYDARKQELGL